MKCSRRFYTQAIIAIVAFVGSLLAASTTNAFPLVDSVIQGVPGAVELKKKMHGMGNNGGNNGGNNDGGNTQVSNSFFPPVPSASSSFQNPTSSLTQDPSTSTQLSSQLSPSTTAASQLITPLSTQHASTYHATTITSANAVHPVASPSSSADALPMGSVMSNDGTTVPTNVSKNAMIGLGATGGFIVCALGGLTLWNRRKKKNLAAEILQQTAQFSNNNPYAKTSELAKVAAGGNTPMTPTTPLGTYNVLAVYTPALADEIEIGLGDSVTILQEYDDGWCMGVNNSRNGVRGVFPRHCLEGYYDDSAYGNSQYDNSQYVGGGNYPPNAGFIIQTTRRMSSIPAGGWNNGPIGYNRGVNNFQNPTSQYNGYYNYNNYNGGY
ncbi:hypothetical protein EDD21DRAFT_375030 [Dissophora ornata]|nr:hypothetical protein BGZ58_008393 [Dissophora ornata]KAI8601234.1 hypothetical protein EDD21DRAFT_375030 [Dissophora ornata]